MITRMGLAAAAVATLASCTNMSLRSPTAVGEPRADQRQPGVRHRQLHAKGELVLVEGRVTGLTPGPHGFHIHGRATAPHRMPPAPAGISTPPARRSAPTADARHAGDLGNLEADASGTAVYRAEVRGISLGAGEDSIIGRAVVVHANRDDLTSQPAGNAGGRQACGLISKSKDKWF
jgi:Cu-Zn family superoxide dismutase